MEKQMDLVETIYIKRIIGLFSITWEDGQQIYDMIHTSLKKNKSIVLDFVGIDEVTAIFFQAAVGQLLSDISETNVFNLLQIKHLNENGLKLMDCTIKHYAQYYGDEDYKEIVINTLE